MTPLSKTRHGPATALPGASSSVRPLRPSSTTWKPGPSSVASTPVHLFSGAYLLLGSPGAAGI